MDVVDREGEVAEVARGAVVLVVVVPGQLDLGLRVFRRAQVHQGEAALGVVVAPGLHQPQAFAEELQHACGHPAEIAREAPADEADVAAVLRLLERNEVPQTFVQDVERLVMKSRSATFHDVLLPLLIRKLYTPNPDVRLRIHQILLYFRKTDFPGSLPKSKDPGALEKWTPSKDESPTKVDEYVRLWELWWKKASTKPSALGTPTPPKPAPASSQKKTS